MERLDEAKREMTFEEEHAILLKEVDELFAQETEGDEPPFVNCIIRRALRCIKKLKAKYQDAEEQGLLLRLPCKVGDTIYVIPSWANYRLNKSFGHSENNRVYPQIVHSVQMWSKDRYSLTTCDGLRSEVSDFYKETRFLTKEEAEQKLAEMT